MPRSDEAQAFFHAVYSAVQEIPPGKVTSYGHIAKLVGAREFTQPLLSSQIHVMTNENTQPSAPAK
jgi:alkylated DNA nucleotide flippase Atl1